jgi:predicted dehydrogenase
MSESLKLGIVGAGQISELMARAGHEAAGVEVIGCTARSPENAKRLAHDCAIDRIYQSFDEMLADDEIDAVYIATPNGLHPSQTLSALGANKHVLVEKPMALTEADAVEMARAADRRELVLGVGFHVRHHAAIRELKRLLETGAIGEPRLIRVSWGMNNLSSLAPWKNDPQIAGGGAIMGIGVHVLDLCCWLLGREPAGISAITDATPDQMDQIDLITMSFGDCLADIQVTRRFELHPNGIVVHGTDGSLAAEGALTMQPEGRLIGPDGNELLSRSQSPYVLQLEAFAVAVHGGAHFHADGWDGVRSVRVTEAVQASSHSSPRAIAR